ALAKPKNARTSTSSTPARVVQLGSGNSKVTAKTTPPIQTCADDEGPELLQHSEVEVRQSPAKTEPSTDERCKPMPPVKWSESAKDDGTDVREDAWHAPARIAPEPN